MNTKIDIPQLAWIAEHLPDLRSKPVVIKVGGSIQDDPAAMRSLMHQVALLSELGVTPAVIHGGGKAISAAMKAAGLTPRFVQGQRYTDEETLHIAERVLVNEVNRELVQAVQERGAQARGLHSLGLCVLRARRVIEPDLGLVGRVGEVDAPVVSALCAAGIVPIIGPVAIDAARDGGKLNVNADLAAGEVAFARGAGTLLMVSDTPGIRTSAAPEVWAQRLSRDDLSRLRATGIIDGGMLPKVEACLRALDAGARRVLIIDGRAPDAIVRTLLLEEPGALAPASPGTRIVE
ncbi:MAG: acetylglutamate kinase [Phycisphaerales bacterium]